MDVERRFAGFEFRAAGDGGPGVLAGVAMRYGTEAALPGGLRERFEPGAFGDVAAADVLANWQHMRETPLARSRGGGLELEDGPRELRATVALPDTTAGRDVATLASRGVLAGFSVEFFAMRDRVEGGIRIVECASLVGLAIVDRPAYPDALATLRARIEGAAASPRHRRIWL